MGRMTFFISFLQMEIQHMKKHMSKWVEKHHGSDPELSSSCLHTSLIHDVFSWLKKKKKSCWPTSFVQTHHWKCNCEGGKRTYSHTEGCARMQWTRTWSCYIMFYSRGHTVLCIEVPIKRKIIPGRPELYWMLCILEITLLGLTR